MELRQLQYFATVAEELNFGRAAQRLLIAGPSLSQQIKALERDLGVQLLDRDRRSVALTAAGAALLPHVRALLEGADDLRSRAARIAGSEAVRIGYVNWLPADLAARASAVAQLHVDDWVQPSHVQVARVADGSLDLAVCWVSARDLEEHGLDARIIGADRLYAVSRSPDAGDARAQETIVLLDDDAATWSTWNAWAGQFARDTGARVVRVRDGGITGPAFFDHARRARRPVINSPKGQRTPLPPDLTRRAVVDPEPYWTWSLVWRRGDVRAAVRAVADALSAGVGDLGIHAPGAWLPDTDPHKLRSSLRRLPAGLLHGANRGQATIEGPPGPGAQREGGTDMRDEEFYERVRRQARLPSRVDAERACYATVTTLSEWVPEGLADNIAAQLPREIGGQLRRTEADAGTGEELGRADFIPRIAARAGVADDQAAFIARAVIDALTAATEGGLMARVTETLPAELREYVTPGQESWEPGEA